MQSTTTTATSDAPSQKKGANDDAKDWVAIVGYGSLLSEKSARITCPSLRRFQPVSVPGYRRVYNLVSISNIKRGFHNWQTKQVAAVVAQPDSKTRPNSTGGGGDRGATPPMLAAYFEIPRSELAAYYLREARYSFEEATVQQWNDRARGGAPPGKKGEEGGADSKEEHLSNEATTTASKKEPEPRAPPLQPKAIICIEYKGGDQAAYLREVYKGDKVRYHAEIGKYYDGPLWRRDILPVERYLQLCLKGAFEIAGQRGVENFLDTSYLADETTTLREYLRKTKGPSAPLFDSSSDVSEAAKAAAAIIINKQQ